MNDNYCLKGFGLKFILFLFAGLQVAWTWPEEAPSIRGFLQGQGAVRTTGSDDSVVLAEERLQLESEYYHDFEDWGSVNLFGKIDGIVDETDRLNDSNDHIDWDVDIRELFLGYSWESLDLRIGRQIITWGIADRIFINDVFPKSWVSFYSGRPLEYLKIGSDGLKLNYYPEDIADFELVVLPFFEHDDFPDGDRLIVFDPAPGLPKDFDEPDNFENIQLGLRIRKTMLEIDWNLYAYRGFYTTQGNGFRFRTDSNGLPRELVYTFPRLHTYGFTAQRSLLDGLAGLEAAYYDSVDDQDGDNPYIENSQTRVLGAYEKEVAEALTIGVQYELEWMLHYDKYRDNNPQGSPVRHEYTQFVTLNVKQLLLHDTLVLSFFTIYGIKDAEVFLNPEVKYHVSDTWWVSLGFNTIESEKQNTRIGQFDRDDNVYFIARYQF